MKKHKSYINYEDIVDKPLLQSSLNLEIKQLTKSQQLVIKKPLLQSRMKNRNSLPILRSALQSSIQERDTNQSNKEYDKLRNEYEQLKSLYTKQEQIIQQLLQENTNLKQMIIELKEKNEDLKINIKRYEQNDESAYQLYLSNQQDTIIKELKAKINSLSEKIVIQEKQAIQPSILTAYIYEYESLCLDLKRQLECKYCGKELKDPVTLIPCAHSYCRTCRRGYQNDCFLCGKDMKLEAVYLNQFMIDMMALYKRNIGLIEQLKNNL